MTEQAMKRVPAIPAALESWVDAMLNHALDGGMSKMAVLRTLAADESNEGPVTWLRLLGLWRPVVLLVDHLDAYYRNPEAGLRIASLLLDMSEMDGVHVVLSLNQDVWQATFGHHLPSAMEDRLTASQMLLRGIGESEAATLLRLRLQHAGVSAESLREFTTFLDVKRYFLGRPLGSVSARTFLRHAAKQWDFFQQTLSSPAAPVAISPQALAPQENGVLPLMTDVVTENADDETADPSSISIFDSSTTAQMKLMAEGLAEPTPALPQQDEAPLHPAPALNGHHHPTPPSVEQLEAHDEETRPQFSPSSAGAFENLREMLGKLRQPSPPHAGVEENGNGTHAVAERLADVLSAAAAPVPVVAAPSNLPAPAFAVAGAAVAVSTPAAVVAAPAHAERDALLGRYEALRLQMAAEAVSLPLDFTKLADLIRLAGKRFPLVRFSEYELPGMTGRYAMCWSLQGLEIVFGLANFADGSYWRTLAGFAAGRLAELNLDAQTTGAAVPRLKITTFKSEREQQSWAILQHSTAFPEELKSHVDAIHLDTQNIASLYAMQRIIKEAESGSLQAPPAQVMSVLARELDFFWKRVTRAA